MKILHKFSSYCLNVNRKMLYVPPYTLEFRFIVGESQKDLIFAHMKSHAELARGPDSLMHIDEVTPTHVHVQQ